jgi:hypothetical protein
MGNIVWEWKLWDHMVQDFDSTKSNYGSIATHPQLLDINYQANANNPDWIHLNSIDYHPTLDQILLSSHAFDEVWIIDHSTTTAQAATHTGGNGGKGGDLLYRWGNPEAYDHGALANKKLFGQHNATWIQNGFPFEDQIMVFNNGNGRPNGNYSTIEIIDPPLNGTTYTASLPYLPNVASWTYNSGNPHNFYAQNISGAQPLSNGNILYCDGPSGTFTEINTLGNSLWTYINPVNNSGVLNQGATPTQNLVFRCSFYPSDYSGFAGKTLIGTHPIEDTNPLSNTCILSAISDESADDSPSVKIYPNPTHAIAHIQIESDTDPYFRKDSAKKCRYSRKYSYRYRPSIPYLRILLGKNFFSADYYYT